MAQISKRYSIRDPDPERARWNMCSSKIGYSSAAEARIRIKKMRGAGLNRLQVYKCAFCAFWHIGNNKKKEKRDERKERRRSEDSGSIPPSD